MKPRKTMCERCPHQFEVRTNSCSIEDRDLGALERPHCCTWDVAYYCRGCFEKMKMNYIEWRKPHEIV
jgi:hypothetical protein